MLGFLDFSFAFLIENLALLRRILTEETSGKTCPKEEEQATIPQ
jgi:hypothetical protein